MDYLSLINGLSKEDLKELAKQMKVCCSGNKTQVCQRILNVLGVYEMVSGEDFSTPITPVTTVRQT